VTAEVTIVVPCFNEQSRWNAAYWREIAEAPAVGLVFVDDGSSDATLAAITETCGETGSEWIALAANAGKGEAVRRGLQAALDRGSAIVGYLDADGAFPAQEVVRLAGMSRDLLLGEGCEYDSLWSSRVLLAGRQIKRRASRHYVGRVVATAIAPFHQYEVYDTQSGYKLFRSDDRMRRCLDRPFGTRWFPDVEILQRWTNLTGSPLRIWEEPVTGWYDVAGSKLDRSQYAQLARDVAHLYRSRVRSHGDRRELDR
jgi:glycosyltransferase involved in cell wall biosynthesis